MTEVQVKITGAQAGYDKHGRFWLQLEIPVEDRTKARGIVRVLNSVNKLYAAVIKPYRKKRSLDANAYYWVLCGKLSEVMNIPPKEIYRGHIRDIGNYVVTDMKSDAVKDFAKFWCRDHEGRLIETRRSNIQGRTTVLAYYGSSDFDSTQMSRLIDNCIQDCQAVGIETMTPEQQAALIERWGT